MPTRCLSVAILAGCTCTTPSTPLPAPAVEGPRVLLKTADLELTQRRWSHGDQSGQAWTVRWPRDARVSIRPSDDVVSLSALLPEPPRAPSWALINGGFYDDGPMGLVRTGGQTLTAVTATGGSGVLLVKDGRAEVIHRSDWAEQSDEALQSIDRLVVDGASAVMNRAPEAQRAARSAIALTDDALWLVIHAADASVASMTDEHVQIRDPYGHGMPLWAFSDWLVDELGATSALNLDGGLSTNLMVQVGDERFALDGVSGTINGVLVQPAEELGEAPTP